MKVLSPHGVRRLSLCSQNSEVSCMNGRKRHRTKQERQALFAEWQLSKLTPSAFARLKGMSPRTFRYWVRSEKARGGNFEPIAKGRDNIDLPPASRVGMTTGNEPEGGKNIQGIPEPIIPSQDEGKSPTKQGQTATDCGKRKCWWEQFELPDNNGSDYGAFCPIENNASNRSLNQRKTPSPIRIQLITPQMEQEGIKRQIQRIDSVIPRRTWGGIRSIPFC